MSVYFNADEVFEMAMDTERNGEAFYRKAMELAKDQSVRDRFKFLMEQEEEHYATFKKLKESLSGKESRPTAADPEDQGFLYLDALVKSRLFTNVREAEELAEKVANEIEALKAALSFEKDTIIFFQTMKELTGENLGKDEIDRIIEEEHKHVILISNAINEAKGGGA